MKQNFLVDIDLNNNQLLNPIVHNLGSAPTGISGRLYYNTTPSNDSMYYYDGTSWVPIGIKDKTYGDIVTSSSGSIWTIGSKAVSLSKIQDIGTNTFLGRISAGTGVTEVLTTIQATSMLNVFSSTLQGLVPLSGGGTSNFLRADGVWTSPNVFIGFNLGATTGAPVSVLTGDTLTIEAGTGITTTVSKATTIPKVTLSLSTSGVSASTYGSASTVPQIAVDTYGRITSASSLSISIPASQINDKITSTLLAGASDTTVASSLAIKTYVDNSIVGGMKFKGDYNASTNTPALDTGLPVISVGDTYVVTVAGVFFTINVEVGDMLMSKVNSIDAASVTDWTIVQANIGQATESTPGYLSLATAAEITTGTNDTKAVTPLKLEGWNGGSSITTLGTISTGVWSGTEILGSKLQNSSETIKGVSEEATDAEVTAGTSTGSTGAKLFVTPQKLKTHLGITATLSVAKKFSFTLNTSATVYTIAHGLSSADLVANVYTISDGSVVNCQINLNSTNVVLSFNTAPAINTYRVVVVG